MVQKKIFFNFFSITISDRNNNQYIYIEFIRALVIVLLYIDLDYVYFIR